MQVQEKWRRIGSEENRLQLDSDILKLSMHTSHSYRALIACVQANMCGEKLIAHRVIIVGWEKAANQKSHS